MFSKYHPRNLNNQKMATRPTPFQEGRIAYLAGQRAGANPHLTEADRSKLKEDWPEEAQKWDDGWTEEYTQENGDKAYERY